MKSRTAIAVLVLLGVLGTVGYELPKFAAGASPAQIKNPNIILASGLAAPYVHYPVAVEKGFFARYGLNPQLRIFASGFEAVQAVGARAAHISNAGEFTLLVPRSKGADLVIVGRSVINVSDGGVGAVKGINGPRDLIGKKCAAVLGGTGEWYAHRYMTVYGIDPKDVTLLNLAAPEWLPAMRRGDIQCFFGWEPWLTELPKIVPGATVIHRWGQDNVYIPQNPVGFNATWVKEDPEGAKAALRALIDTLAWVNLNRQEAAQIAAKAFRMDSAELATMMDCCFYRMDFPQPLVDLIAQMTEWGTKRGIIDMPSSRLMSILLFPDLMKAVAPERCTAEVCKKR